MPELIDPFGRRIEYLRLSVTDRCYFRCFYCIPKGAPHRDAAYAFINFLQDPYVQAREAAVHGYAPADSRAIALQPDSLGSDPILHPALELMNGLEFGAAQTLTDPLRAEVIARFKSA